MSQSVAIVGGGISGLAAANKVRSLLPDTAITILEASDRFGGKIFTEHVGPLVIEGGADSFLSAKSRGVGLSRELGLEDEELSPNPGNRGAFILYRGRLEPLPEGISGLVTFRPRALLTSRLISPLGKLRVLLDVVVPTNLTNEDESVASFFTRRLGSQFYNNLIEPLMTGVYGGDGQSMSLAATFAHWRTAERTYGSLTRALLAARRESARRAQEFRTRQGFTSFRNGLGVLPDALVDRLSAQGVTMKTGAKVTSLGAQDDDGTYEVTWSDPAGDQSARFDAVVVAVPAPAAARLLQPLDTDAARALADIQMGSTALVALSFARASVKHSLRGTGYIVPAAAQRQVMAMTWMSSKWEHRAPADTVLLRGFVGRERASALLAGEDGPLVDAVRAELRDILSITAQPEVVRVYRWSDSMPQYSIGHIDRVRRIETGCSRLEGIEIAGNMLHGVGIPDCIASGEQAAANVVGMFAERASRMS